MSGNRGLLLSVALAAMAANDRGYRNPERPQPRKTPKRNKAQRRRLKRHRMEKASRQFNLMRAKGKR